VSVDVDFFRCHQFKKRFFLSPPVPDTFLPLTKKHFFPSQETFLPLTSVQGTFLPLTFKKHFFVSPLLAGSDDASRYWRLGRASGIDFTQVSSFRRFSEGVPLSVQGVLFEVDIGDSGVHRILWAYLFWVISIASATYRGTSLIRNSASLGSCSRTMPMALHWS